MTTRLNPELFNKVENLAHTVLEDLKKKGYVVPTRVDSKTISFHGYVVGQDDEGFYYIKNSKNFTDIRKINLPQTAAVVANDLALGKALVGKLLDSDRMYGYKMFDQEVYKRCMKRHKSDIDKYCLYQTRLQDAKKIANSHKQAIINSFEKLRSLR